MNWLVPQFLPYAWLLILTWLTWDLLRTKPLKNLADAAYLRWGTQYPVWTYVIIFVIGGTLLSIYWAGITGVLALVRNRHNVGTAEISPPSHAAQTPVQGPSPRFTEKFDHFIITAGGWNVKLGNINGTRVRLYAFASNGTGIGGPADSDLDGVFASVSDGQILVDADVFTKPNDPPMRIRRNEITNRPLRGPERERGWDKNYSQNNSAIEIVNEEGVPVFQIIYLDEAQVVINGVFVRGERITVLDNGQTHFGFKGDIVTREPIKRIFKYPSWKYLHVFEEETPTQPSPTPNTEASPN